MTTALRACLVLAYLAAIVAANLITAHFAHLGHPEASVYTAFALVAFDLVARDLLHDWFTGLRRVLGLGSLIVAGSALSYLANPSSAQVAKWSALAFAAAMIADGVVYAIMHRWMWAERSNASNVAGAITDSAVFCAGLGFPFVVAFGQFTAKVAGGALLVAVIAEARHRNRVRATVGSFEDLIERWAADAPVIGQVDLVRDAALIREAEARAGGAIVGTVRMVDEDGTTHIDLG